ncbi:STAS domain-containing protein [Micromonospora parva]|uniref:STAS domain-containing protein n=1 Tax=Micromonospora TaxID=1873 RepID=UPI0009E01C54|nr:MULTISPECIES: STAS domain-containing protein [Micromonospora]MBQ1028634.1 STAS domain-containing protein [Micromonospora sp. C97]
MRPPVVSPVRARARQVGHPRRGRRKHVIDQTPLSRPVSPDVLNDQGTVLVEPILSLTMSHDGPVSVISVVGEMDMSNAHLLIELVEQLCRAPTPRIALNLSAVRFLGAHGISALLRSGQLAAQAGGRLTLRDPSPFVLRVLGVTRLLRHLERDDTSTPTGARISGVVAPPPRRAAPPHQPLSPSVADQP